jgi:hypothetical protein
MLDYTILENAMFYKDFREITMDEELSLMFKLTFAWQQNTHMFLKYTPKEFLDYFISNFKESNKTYYRGIWLNDINDLEENQILTASTSDINISRNIFAFKKDEGCKNYIYEIKGELELDVEPIADFGEKEFILYKAKLIKLVEII